jgi:hypothetical protein
MKMIFGKGTNDLEGESSSIAYTTWHSMLRRCYSDLYQKRKPTYKGCSVKEEWMLFSVFKLWFDKNYMIGWALDKDILFLYNKLYSEGTCCFVPAGLNTFYSHLYRVKKDGNPLGVYFKKSNKKYVAQASLITPDGKRGSGHLLISESLEDCVKVYKEHKKKALLEMADSYKSVLKPEVYNALVNFKWEVL